MEAIANLFNNLKKLNSLNLSLFDKEFGMAITKAKPVIDEVKGKKLQFSSNVALNIATEIAEEEVEAEFKKNNLQFDSRKVIGLIKPGECISPLNKKYEESDFATPREEIFEVFQNYISKGYCPELLNQEVKELYLNNNINAVDAMNIEHMIKRAA